MSAIPWWALALASACCAAVIPVLAKVGLRSVNPDLATILRSVVMTVVLLVLGSAVRVWTAIPTLREGGSRALLFIVLTGVAGAFSWAFYFRALQAASVAKVVPLDKLSVPFAIVLSVLMLGERPSLTNWIGIAMVIAGGVLATLPAR